MSIHFLRNHRLTTEMTAAMSIPVQTNLAGLFSRSRIYAINYSIKLFDEENLSKMAIVNEIGRGSSAKTTCELSNHQY